MPETLIPQTLIPMADLLRRRRKWILLLAGTGVSGYFVYRRRRKLCSLIRTLIAIADAISSSAETVAVLSSDLSSFLRSNSDEIPASFKQLAKIARSDEFVDSVSRFSEALTLGIVKGIGSGSVDSVDSGPGLPDRVLDKVFSPAGTGFASVVVGSFAKNLVVGLMERESDSSATPAWIEIIGNDQAKDLVANCIEKFVGTMVSVYLEKTAGINTYDEFFAGITNPKHDAKVKDFFVSVCNGAVESLIKTSHNVITTQNEEKGGNTTEDTEESGWFDKVSTTLAVPSNRKLVLDVTGRVTFETVRSFLDFALWRLYDGAKRGVTVVGDEVTERGMEVVRYFSAKSMLIVTICFAMCMRVVAGTRLLMPA